MAVTRTFSIIKPDATRRNLTGAVTKMLEEAGLRVVASKRIHMTREQAEGFYAVHQRAALLQRPVSFMISGPVVVQVLEGEDAVKRNRDVMGATNPDECRRRHDPQGTTPNRSRPIRSTARTATRMRRSRSPTSSRPKKSSAELGAIQRQLICSVRLLATAAARIASFDDGRHSGLIPGNGLMADCPVPGCRIRPAR